MDVAGAWSWRLIVIAGAGWVVWKGLGHVSLLVIAMMVAMLLAALLSPTVMLLRKKGVRAGGAAAIAELGLLLLLAVIISLTGQSWCAVSPRWLIRRCRAISSSWTGG